MRNRLMKDKEMSGVIHIYAPYRNSIEIYPKDKSIHFGVLDNIAPKMYSLDWFGKYMNHVLTQDNAH